VFAVLRHDLCELGGEQALGPVLLATEGRGGEDSGDAHRVQNFQIVLWMAKGRETFLVAKCLRATRASLEQIPLETQLWQMTAIVSWRSEQNLRGKKYHMGFACGNFL